MRSFLKYYIFIFITFLILFNPQSTIIYAKSGLSLCIDVLIPSLFPFFVCSGLLIYSGFAGAVSGLFKPVMRPLFNVNGAGASAFLLGIISGYPLGASCACNLYDSGYLSKPECERLLAFCNNSGPLFILGSVGTAIFHSPKAGIILYTAHITAALLVGLIFRFYKYKDVKATDIPIYNPNTDIGEVFRRSLQSSINSILTVCGAVIFFSVIANIMADFFSDGSPIKTLFISAGEITSGINSIASLPLPISVKLTMAAACAGFAGLCVHLQVMGTVSGRGLSLKPYIIGKCIHSALSALITAILLHFFPITKTVFSFSYNTALNDKLSGAFFFGSLYAISGILIFLCITFLFLIFIKITKTLKRKRRAI